MELDRKDFALLEALQKDASLRLEDLAKEVQLAPSSVHDRLRRLQRDGIIKNWTIKVDAAKIGLGILAFVGVTAGRCCADIKEELMTIRCIEECHSVAGALSMLLKVRVPDTEALMALFQRLRQIPGIEKVETTIVLQTQIDRPIPLQAPPAAKREGGSSARGAA